MAAKRLELGSRARADLASIWTYTEEQWSAAQARSYTDELNAAMQGLAEGSRIGHPAQVEGFQRLSVGAHVIFYRERARLIRVVRILHARQDAASRLGRGS